MPEQADLQDLHSEEVQDIIKAVPPWILRWGITLLLIILISFIGLSALIEYPDIVKARLKVNSLNGPKTVLAKQSAKLSQLLVEEGQTVKEGQLLAYFETTASPQDVLKLDTQLKSLKKDLFKQSARFPKLSPHLNLGELQGVYQLFYQQYLQYQSTQQKGYYQNRITYLKKDLKDIEALKRQILQQQKIQKQEMANQESEYKAYQQLYKNKVISRSEFTQQENKYLASKYPLQQSQTALINNTSSYTAKEKELLDLQHTIADEQAKFVQALNKYISESEAWVMQYALTAPITGTLSYAGIVQENQNITAGEELFIVKPDSAVYFGEVQIPQYNMGKIREGERTLVKLESYPFEQYGVIFGKLTYVSDVAYRDSVFMAKVKFESFENEENKEKIVLKNGMLAQAEIITEESSLLQRFFRNIVKLIDSK